MHESASYSDHSMRPALCIRAPGSSAGSFLFWQRLLSMVRRLLRWSGLRLLSELLRLRRLLSAFLAASILRRVLWRLARARLGSWTGRGSWTRRPLARSSLIPSNRCQMPLALQGQRALSRSLAPACLLGLKPWAKSCSPSGAINYPKSCLSSRHSTQGFLWGESLPLGETADALIAGLEQMLADAKRSRDDVFDVPPRSTVDSAFWPLHDL